MAIRIRTLLAAAAGAALLGGCATAPYDYGYNGYNDNGYAYNYGPGPAYYDEPGYYGAPGVGVGIGFSDWDSGHRHGDRRDWHGDGNRDWHGGGHDGHGGDHGDHGGHDWQGGGDHGGHGGGDVANDHGQNSGG